MNRYIYILLLVLMAASAAIFSPVQAQTFERTAGWCEQGNQVVTTSGVNSTTKVQRSYPSCTVTVYDQGTLNLATIYTDYGVTPKSNPFTANANGSYDFVSGTGRYDIVTSGAGQTVAFTRPGVWVAASQSFNLTVKEDDGSPSVSNVDTIQLLGGTVTSLGSGDVRLTTLSPNSTIGAVPYLSATLTLSDTPLTRETANQMSQRNGTNTQRMDWYHSFTDASNYQGLGLSFTSTGSTFASTTSGSGADNLNLNLSPAGTGFTSLNESTTITNAIQRGLQIDHQTTGIPAANFGVSLAFTLETTTTTVVDAAQISTIWTTATGGAQTSRLQFGTVLSGLAMQTIATLDQLSGLQLGIAGSQAGRLGLLNAGNTNTYTLVAPTSPAANRTITLPEVPASTQVLVISNTGAITASSTAPTSVGGSSGQVQWNNGGVLAGISGSVATTLGELTLASSARTGSAGRYFAIQTPADTSLTADTERVGIALGGNGSLATVIRQFTAGGGTFTAQREVLVVAPTYSFTSADTIGSAATFAVSAAPTAGTNATITQARALEVTAGKSWFGGDLVGLDTNERATLRIDASSGASAASTLMLFHPTGQPTQVATANFFQTSIGIGGTGRDIGIQLQPDTNGSYAMFAGYTAAGTVIANQNNTNPIFFGVNSVLLASMESGGRWLTRSGNGSTPSTNNQAMDGTTFTAVSGVNLGAGAQTLTVRTLLANEFGRDGDWMTVRIFGRLSGANNKVLTIRANQGANNVDAAVSSTFTTSGSWEAEANFRRDSSTQLAGMGWIVRGGSGAVAAIDGKNDANNNSFNFTNTINIQIVSNDTDANGATYDRMYIVKHNAP
jgi:hypothetical protein